MNNSHSKIIAVFIICLVVIFALLKICDFNGVTETLTSGKINASDNLSNSTADSAALKGK